MIILGPSQSESYNMGKNRKLKLSQERSIGSESSEESIFGQGCPHVKKAVNFMAMRKVILKEKLGDCRDCTRKGSDSNTKGQKPPEPEPLLDGYEPTFWICLQCGHQGCDRNSQDKHALKHYETPRSSSHLIVINTTSWSTWCYKCDDEIPIEKHKKIIECLDFLKQQAGVSKIALDTGKKEASSRLSNDTASENKGENKTAKGKAALSKNVNSVMNVRIKGLSNLGNTCFFNAVLQNLSQTHGLENILKDGNRKGASLGLPGWQPIGTDSCSEISDDSSDEDHSEDNTQAMAKLSSLVWRIFTKERRKGFKAEIAAGTSANCNTRYQPPIDITIPEAGPLTRSLLAFLHEMTTSSNHNSTINPCSLFGQVCKRAPRFKGFQQQDSHELLRYLLDVMRTEEIRRSQTGILRHFKLSENTNPNKVDNKTKTKIKEYGRQAKHTFIDRLFGGHLISTVSCEVCQHMSQIFEPFLDLSLPVTEEKVKHIVAERKQKRMAKKVAKLKARQEEDDDEMENEKETHKTEENPTCNEVVDTSDADVEDNVENEVTTSTKKPNEMKLKHYKTKEENKNEEVSKTDSTLLTNDSKIHSKVASKNNLKVDSDGSTDGLHKEVGQIVNRFECLQVTDNKTASNSEEDCKSSTTGDKMQDSNRSEQECTPKETEEQSKEQCGSFVTTGTNGSAPLLHMACSSGGLEKGTIEASESVSKCNETDGSEQSAEIVTEQPAKETLDASEEMPVNNGSAFGNHVGEGQGPVMASKSSSSSSIGVAQLLSNCSHGPPLAHPGEEDIDDVDEKEYINMSTIKRQAQAKSMSTLSPRYQPSSRECSIMSCLHQFTSAELLMGNNKVRCKNCTRRKAKNSSNNAAAKEVVYTNASKQFLIFRPPAILTLHLKRFEQIGFSSRKVNRHVDFPFVLDIAPFCSALSQSVEKGQKNVLYSLYGIVEHNGRLSGGHYTAYVKVCRNNINKPNSFLSENQLNPKEYILRYRALLLSGGNNEKVETNVDVDSLVPSGKWYHISDSHVREVSETAVRNAQAYLLFYERIY